MILLTFVLLQIKGSKNFLQKKLNLGLQLRSVYDIIPFAVRDDGGKYRGVEQLVARRAHNPKVVSSSLTPATIEKQTPIYGVCFFIIMNF